MRINRSLLAALLMFIIISCARNEKNVTTEIYQEPVSGLYDSTLRPFYHGVASGDPLPDRVILWTRVTPVDPKNSINVTWEISEDARFTSIYKSDSAHVSPEHDFTLKVDVDALKPNHIYYYRFFALGKYSITGRTKTAPVGNVDSLKFAIATCANWEWGYFNAYARIADREIVDAVIHLGDYIYEYGTGKYGDTTIGRINIPRHEIVTLNDYRTRYSQYRLDEGLRRVHQQHPFIAIWDDHEIANDSYSEGAANHQSTEGNYTDRKAAAKKAYYEWLPIREGSQLYRSFAFGDLADVFMMDERLAGRTKPVTSLADKSLLNSERSMLGSDQLNWFENQLVSSHAKWKIIGNQVLFSNLDQSAVRPKMPRNLDSWDGYPVEQKKIKDFIVQKQLKNIVFVTGDTHASWAIEAATEVHQSYAPFAIEFGTTSISSSNDNEFHPTDSVKLMETALLKMNPHVKFFNDRDHGYMMLSVYRDKIRSEWFYVETLRTPDNREFLGKTFEVNDGKLKLK